jgi:hypothetical protein
MITVLKKINIEGSSGGLHKLGIYSTGYSGGVIEKNN